MHGSYKAVLFTWHVTVAGSPALNPEAGQVISKSLAEREEQNKTMKKTKTLKKITIKNRTATITATTTTTTTKANKKGCDRSHTLNSTFPDSGISSTIVC